MKMYRKAADVILLPELFSTGFTMNTSRFGEHMEGNTVKWMKTQAELTDSVVGGSIIVSVNGIYFNRFCWVSPGKELTYYDKRHLFRMGGENQHFAAGNKIINVELKGWRIRLNICYDLRFPVWIRNTGDYDLLINIANWPAGRKNVWNKLLMARAIENQCYVAGVNRVGKDGNGISYSGDSMVIDYRGEPVKILPSYKETTALVEINLQALREFRNKFPVHLDSDRFKIL